MPCGAIDFDDFINGKLNFYDAIQREVFEEIGKIPLHNIKFLGIMHDDNLNCLTFGFVAKTDFDSEVINVKYKSDEFVNIDFVDKNNIKLFAENLHISIHWMFDILYYGNHFQ